jgi:hypothetical protein
MFDFFGTAKKGTQLANKGYGRLTEGIDQSNQTLGNAKTESINFIDEGIDNATPYFKDIQNLYADTGEQAGDMQARAMYLNSLGLNGAEGAGTAKEAFLNSVSGGDTALDFANQNYMRHAAAMGQVNSGRLAEQLYEQGRGFQNQRIDDWNNRLQGFDPYKSLGGQAAALTGLANLQSQGNLNKANMVQNYAMPMAENNRATGQAGYQNAQDVFGAQSMGNQESWSAILGGLSGLGGLLGGFG